MSKARAEIDGERGSNRKKGGRRNTGKQLSPLARLMAAQYWFETPRNNGKNTDANIDHNLYYRIVGAIISLPA